MQTFSLRILSNFVKMSKLTGCIVGFRSRIPVSSLFSHFGHDVNAAEQQLIEVAALHQLRAVDESVFETCPDFPPQV